MIYINPKLDKAYLREESKFNLSKLINEKSFTKSNTPLSYRQINTLSNDKLIPEERDNSRDWRKFSLKELIFFKIIFELKKFGLTHETLKGLSDSFFKEPTAEIAIGCVLIQAEIMITLKSDGTVTYYDPPHFILIGSNETPMIQIRLNDIVNNVRKNIKQKPFPISMSVSDYLWRRSEMRITDNEKEIISMIRNNAYSSLTVSKKDGGSYLVHADRSNNEDKINARDVLKMLEKKDFQDIKIIQRNGMIVHYNITETYKL